MALNQTELKNQFTSINHIELNQNYFPLNCIALVLTCQIITSWLLSLVSVQTLRGC